MRAAIAKRVSRNTITGMAAAVQQILAPWPERYAAFRWLQNLIHLRAVHLFRIRFLLRGLNLKKMDTPRWQIQI